MIGAVAGDIIGSPYEWNNTEDFSFKLFESNYNKRYNGDHITHPHMTDESVVTLAVARWMLMDDKRRMGTLENTIKSMCQEYEACGLSSALRYWANEPESRAMRSDSNIAAAMISPVAMTVPTLKEALVQTRNMAQMMFSNENSIKGAEAMCEAIWLVRNGHEKDDVKFAIENGYGYDLSMPLDEMYALARGAVKEEIVVNDFPIGEYYFRETGKRAFDAETTVTAAIRAYLDGSGFEDTVRRAVITGGDSDTIASMAGALAGARYGVPEEISKRCAKFLPEDLRSLTESFERIGIRDGFQRSYVTKKPDDRFYLIRHGENERTFVVSQHRKELVSFLKQRFGESVHIIRSGQMEGFVNSLQRQELKGTYLETPRPDVRTMYFQNGRICSPSSAEGISMASQADRDEARQSFLDLADYAQRVKTQLQAAVGYHGSGSIHFDNAYYPEIFKDKIEIWKGDLFAGSVGIDPTSGLLRMSQGGDYGPMEWFDKTTDSVFMYSSFMDFKESIGRFCLDEGISEKDPGRQLNIEVANDDVAHSQDNRLLKAIEQKQQSKLAIK